MVFLGIEIIGNLPRDSKRKTIATCYTSHIKSHIYIYIYMYVCMYIDLYCGALPLPISLALSLSSSLSLFLVISIILIKITTYSFYKNAKKCKKTGKKKLAPRSALPYLRKSPK